VVLENTIFRRKRGPNLREPKQEKEGGSYIYSIFVPFTIVYIIRVECARYAVWAGHVKRVHKIRNTSKF
jgi:hypothetical protein